MTVWSQWCRLCAREPPFPLPLPSSAYKYLSISISNQNSNSKTNNTQQFKNAFPSVVCQICYETLSSFDNYANQCVKVQCMFETLMNDKDSFPDNHTCKTFRNNFLQLSDSDDDKFIPICTIKAEEDIPVGELGKCNKIVAEPLTDFTENGYFVKDETNGDFFNDAATNSCSDDDHLPLSSLNVSLKRKSKKIKNSLKTKRKKSSKSSKDKQNLFEEINENGLNIKTEPFIDSDNLMNSTKLSSKKAKLEEKHPYSETILSFDCYICKESCNNWHALCLHFRDHHNSRAKVMCCCGKFLASRVSIGRHCASHGKSNSFNCTKCIKRFPRESELLSHMITHLPKEEYPYVCCKCARRFTSQHLLKHHEKKHIPMEERLIHFCKLCKSKFASKSSLVMHIKAVHERVKPFVCDQCGSAFTTKGILEEHQAKHSDATPYTCSVCQKGFKTKQRLAIHLDTHKDTVYQCPRCPMQLNSRRTLRMHLFVHDDTLRYQCNFCDKAFRRAKDLKNHSNLHTGRRPYTCPWCTRTFANGSNCRAHKRRMHPNELRIHDATTGIKSKEQMESQEDEKNFNTHPPKVIYTVLKRKIDTPLGNITSQFTFPPDISKNNETSNEKNTNNYTTILDKKVLVEKSSLTKQEKCSPSRLHESSSPLNLNASALTEKNTDMKTKVQSLIVTAIGHGEESTVPILEFRPSDEYSDIPVTIIPKKDHDYPEINFTKNIQEQTFRKSIPMYSNFNENHIHNIFDNSPSLSNYSATHSYGTNFERDTNS